MQKILGLLLALFASVAFSATTVPVQLLSPTGSTAGQAVVSTGASTAPTWGGIGLNGIAAISGNTVIGNATNSSAVPTAVAVPNCFGSAFALTYAANGTGFSCNGTINALTLGGNAIGTSGGTIPLLNGINTWSGAQTFTALITPTSSIGIKATVTNDSPAAGSVGEQMTTAGSGISLPANTPTNCTSVNLTAGEWTVYGQFAYIPSSATATTLSAGANTTSATLPAAPDAWLLQSTALGTGNQTGTIPMRNFKFTATTQVFLVVQANFTGGTATATCRIFAWRPR